MTERQTQRAGSESTAIQVSGDLTVGLTYEEARAVAQDVFYSLAPQLTTAAAQQVSQRVEQFSQRLLDALHERDADYEPLADPDVQRRLRSAQVAYASSGDDDLGDLLVELMVQRFEESDRNRRQVILNQAIEVVDRLTSPQCDALSTIFLLWEVRAKGIDGFLLAKQWMEAYIAPVTASLPGDDEVDYRHLQYVGAVDRVFHDVDLKQRLSVLFGDASDVDMWTEDQLTELVAAAAPLEQAWASILNRLRLTPVGLVVGHANLRRKTAFSTSLSVWLP